MRILVAVLVAALPAVAQTATTAPRADGKQTPLMVYEAQHTTQTCPNLALLSHGAGGSDRGLAYLAHAMSEAGWTAIVMGHQESGPAAVREGMQGGRLRNGLQALLNNPAAMQGRMLDIGAALAWQAKRCVPAYKVLMGHSMGAETVMFESGATNTVPVKAGADRFDAYVALSPQGAGTIFSEGAWKKISKPVLVMTGTRDGGMEGDYHWRLIPYQQLPATSGGCHWLGVVDGATHADFGGHGPDDATVQPLVISTVKSFVAGAQRDKCSVPAAQSGLTLTAK